MKIPKNQRIIVASSKLNNHSLVIFNGNRGRVLVDCWRNKVFWKKPHQGVAKFPRQRLFLMKKNLNSDCQYGSDDQERRERRFCWLREITIFSKSSGVVVFAHI